MFLDAFRSQQFVEAPEHAYPVPQLLQVQLLVRRVQPVVRQPDAGENHRGSAPAEGGHHGDRPTGARGNGAPPHHFAKRLIEQRERRVSHLYRGRVRAVQERHARLHVPGREALDRGGELALDGLLKTVERQLAAAVKRFAPRYVQASVTFLHGADPATVKVTHPAFALLDQAFREVVGRGTIPARAGGSIPVVPALGRGGAPVILTGIGLPDDRLHAPNEKLDLKQLWDGIRVFRRFYELLGSKGV